MGKDNVTMAQQLCSKRPIDFLEQHDACIIQ